MKILILGFTKLAYMPYMNFYIEQLVKTEHEVHLLYWNRDGKLDISVDKRIILHEFVVLQKDEVAKWKKIGNFLKYRATVKKIINEIDIDFIIVMHSLPGVLIYDILKKEFKERFILDLRDITFENWGIFRKAINNLVNKSRMTFVSSDAFRKYLPKIDKIYTSHNILIDSLKNQMVRISYPREHVPIRIRYWGFIRHENINRMIIDGLANDRRFELHYHGREQATAANLKKYCIEKKINNIFFHGEYKPVDRYVFAAETEIIHNLYENDKATKHAMGNKYYDGIVFRIPQLCNRGSFMGELVSAKKIGLTCDPYSKSFADDIFQYYISLPWNVFEESCNNNLNKILSEYYKGVNVMKEVL